MMGRPFVRRDVAPVRPDRLVESRIARPRLQHAAIEFVAVHLGANEMPVHLLGNRPVADIEGIEPRA